MAAHAPTAPAPMESHGGYNRRSRVQAAGLSPAMPLLQQAARAVLLPPAPLAVTIADYGAAEGHNSLAPLASAIRILRDRIGAERAISVIHTDVAENDFTGLFETLIADPESYMNGDRAIFPSAVGRSFYQQILPAESVTLGWSSWAVQWLSRMPMPIPDHVQVAFTRDAKVRAAFLRRAEKDWRLFLAMRGRELCAGGKLVVLTMALSEAGEFGYAPLMSAMYAGLEDMVGQGFLRAEEMHRMTIPTVGRSRGDLLEPFGPDRRFAGLCLQEIEVFSGEDRIWKQFEQDGDAAAFGARWAAFPRASVFPTLAEGLDGGADDPRAAAFFDRLEASIAQRLDAAPEPMLIPLAKMLLAKDG